ncbi:MAG: hypothetical protein AAF799_27470 [Myxococcota bacterium]
MRAFGLASVALGLVSVLVFSLGAGLQWGLETEAGQAVSVVLWAAAVLAIALGGVRLCMPGEAGRTRWGIGLACFAAGLWVLQWTPEQFPSVFGGLTLVVHVLGNVVVTARILRERCLDATDRGKQLAAVWLLPVLGVIWMAASYRAGDNPWRNDGYSSSDGGYIWPG